MINYDEITVGMKFVDSSGDYVVTDRFRYVGWTQVRIAPDDFRGTPGRSERGFTVTSSSFVLRNFRRA